MRPAGNKQLLVDFLKQKICFKNQYILLDMTMSLPFRYIWGAIGLMHSLSQGRDRVFKNTAPFLEMSRYVWQASSLESQLIWQGKQSTCKYRYIPLEVLLRPSAKPSVVVWNQAPRIDILLTFTNYSYSVVNVCWDFPFVAPAFSFPLIQSLGEC